MGSRSLNKPEKKYPVGMDQLLKETVQREGSDMHLSADVPPVARVDGELCFLDYPPLAPEDVAGLLGQILTPEQLDILHKRWELDFSYSQPGFSRYRGNAMFQRGSISVAIRVIPYKIPNIDELGLPPAVKKLCYYSRGLVLVTGATGSGKSTTLAAMIDLINRERSRHIVTVEDPIEFLHEHKKSTVKQREVKVDTHSFADALRHVLRHDPDVILIGEMRDLESIAIALTAAETGHLVFSTLHTQTAPQAISRIVDVFQDQRKSQVRQQLANTLRGVISQQLLSCVNSEGRVVAVELMLETPAIRNMIREGKEHQLYNAIQTNQHLGMQTMDQALGNLCLSGKISRQNALEHCIDSLELERLLQGKGNISSNTRWNF